ncbi:molecular chaperone [Oleiphilus messinensis]|uniref:Molecular chaperone n=1 Tax=Oleiphilus messinensis TaxID=141451 RepID=A0A1Y0I8Y2_9GAMM|nr:Hsp70 family protein [Oleiphilus messinensis]ARU56972.1 molecular chaperone [Oleiphilus messinensis]
MTHANSEAKFIVGIDLGTTHSVVCYLDKQHRLDHREINVFEIHQLVAAGEVGRRPLLPSFRYHPIDNELSEADIALPWDAQLPGDLHQVVIGSWARELGAKMDGRLVSSAKSWLSHPGINPENPLLPWGESEGVGKVSPVVASASYLFHIRQSWNHDHPDAPLEDQEIIVTIPASFDELARSLTLKAANLAGLREVLLLEEPQAVCYDWYGRHSDSAATILEKSQSVLICDIGGGTTDLSLIKVSHDTDAGMQLDRVGVGDHLMLGGDNIDLALARISEQRLAGSKKLNSGQLAQLIQQTRKVKELLLKDGAPESAKVTVLGSGSKLLGGTKSCDLLRSEVVDIAINGFLPKVDIQDRPMRRKSAVVEFGLPYAADPAITKHLAEFIQRHSTEIPDTLLLNGGVFNSPAIVAKIKGQLDDWLGKSSLLLNNARPDLAVAFGAVSYGLARSGAQLKIGGGSARSYFLLIETGSEQSEGVCILPKSTNEETEIRLVDRKFELRLGQPVRFNLMTTSSDQAFNPGEISALGAEFNSLPPLYSVLSGNAEDSQSCTVELAATLTEVGTLKLECVDSADDAHRWLVEFTVRQPGSDTHSPAQSQELDSNAPPSIKLPPRFNEIIEQVDLVYGETKKGVDPKAIKRLRADIEKAIGSRDTWDTALSRALADVMLNGIGNRTRTMAHERVWLNLTGYTMRPGFGAPLDDWRISQVWPLFSPQPVHNKENQSWSEWWIFWRRISGGLNQEQQQEIYNTIRRYIDPKSLQSRKTMAEVKLKSYEDMVRLAASLEHLPVASKSELGNWLVKRLQKKSETLTSWWALGRVGSRIPFHGYLDNVVHKDDITPWLETTLKADWKQCQPAAFAAVMMARLCGDRDRDIDDNLRNRIIAQLTSSKCPKEWVGFMEEVTELSEADTKKVFGESLPAGLKLIE